MKNMIFKLIGICFILTGCFSNQTGNEPLNVNDKVKLVTENENNLTLEKVTAGLKTEGIDMFKEKLNNDWVLNNVNANRFSVSRLTVKRSL
jgi:protein involved in sex pheromone biosynthesis